MTQFDLQYKAILRDVIKNGSIERNKRTGVVIRALPGKIITITPEGGFPALTLRKMSIPVMVAEPLWFLTGSRRPDEFLNHFTKMWDDFKNIDGSVTSAYGYRWRHHFGRDQIKLLIAMLEDDKTSRQGVVITWDPAGDGLGGVSKKNVPCPFTFVVNILDNKLNMHNIIRSQDLIPGCPFDATTFGLLQRLFAARLGVDVGTYSHWLCHAHVYEPHFGIAAELLKRKNDHPPIHFKLKRKHFDTAMEGLNDMDALIQVAKEIIEIITPLYNPLPAIKGIPIIL
jgi:thymidylate synthase